MPGRVEGRITGPAVWTGAGGGDEGLEGAPVPLASGRGGRGRDESDVEALAAGGAEGAATAWPAAGADDGRTPFLGRAATAREGAAAAFVAFFPPDFADELAPRCALFPETGPFGAAGSLVAARATEPVRAVRFMGSSRAGERVRYHFGGFCVNALPVNPPERPFAPATRRRLAKGVCV